MDALPQTVRQALIGRPVEFYVGRRTFRLYPMTLGRSLVIEAYVERLKGDGEAIAADPVLETLRLATQHTREVATVVALATSETRREILDAAAIERKAKFLAGNVPAGDLASIFLDILMMPTPESVISSLGLDEEQRRQGEIAREKNRNGDTLTFGGKSVYGLLVAPACELFHCLPEKVIWETSLMNLRLTLADRVTTVHLSEEERRRLCIYGSDVAMVEDMTIEELMASTAG